MSSKASCGMAPRTANSKIEVSQAACHIRH